MNYLTNDELAQLTFDELLAYAQFNNTYVSELQDTVDELTTELEQADLLIAEYEAAE